MSEFRSHLLTDMVQEAHETGSGRPMYQLHEDFVYFSDLLQRDVVVPKGYLTDFASVPRVPLAWWLTGGHGNRAAVIHDYLCGTIDRATADKVFREALATSGTPGWRTWVMYVGVRIGAFFSRR